MNYYFELGAAAARRDNTANTCPFPIGAKRQGWLDGYYSVKPLGEKNEPPRVKRTPHSLMHQTAFEPR